MSIRDKIRDLDAWEVLDSRGMPTICCALYLESGGVCFASVPAGKSVGIFEAKELRDGDSARYNGYGVMRAVALIKTKIAQLLRGLVVDLEAIDQLLIAYDGTPDKSHCGANTLLAVSCAVARAVALSEGRPLYESIASRISQVPQMPLGMFNLINGGAHASMGRVFQECMVVPIAERLTQSRRLSLVLPDIFSISQQLKKIVMIEQGWVGLGDEGGIIVGKKNSELVGELESVDLLNKALVILGLSQEYGYALDSAASQFFNKKTALYHIGKSDYTSKELMAFYKNLAATYSLVALEDPFAEEDLVAWRSGVDSLAGLDNKCLIVGDDLCVSQALRIKQAGKQKLVNAVIIKPNQVGTVTEALQAVAQARACGLRVVVSHRSGETCDDFIADFAVGVGADYVKFGACERSERLAKYNRLLIIERALYGESAT